MPGFIGVKGLALLSAWIVPVLQINKNLQYLCDIPKSSIQKLTLATNTWKFPPLGLLEPSAGKCQQKTAQLKHDLQFFLNGWDTCDANYWCPQKGAVKELFYLFYSINLCSHKWSHHLKITLTQKQPSPAAIFTSKSWRRSVSISTGVALGKKMGGFFVFYRYKAGFTKSIAKCSFKIFALSSSMSITLFLL